MVTLARRGGEDRRAVPDSVPGRLQAAATLGATDPDASLRMSLTLRIAHADGASLPARFADLVGAARLNMALGDTPVQLCSAGDRNGDGTISVGEIIAATLPS